MLFVPVRKLRRWSALVGLGTILAADLAGGQPAPFSETWESYTNGITPYSGWKLDRGSWGEISNRGLGGGKFYLVGEKSKSRIRHEVDLSAGQDIVLQGWLYDSGNEVNCSVLGLIDKTNNSANALIRIGIGAADYRTYTIVFYDRLQSDVAITVDTKLPFEKGWHFMRLDILQDRTVRYQVWNAAQTVEKKGSFGWAFDKKKLTWVTVGSLLVTPGAVGWDDIKAGSLEQIGPPPPLPHSPPERVKPKEEGMQLWLKFEDEAAASAVDASGHNLPCVLRAGASITNRVERGRCLDLDGNGGYLELPPGFDDFTQGLTIAFWARPASEGKWARFLDLGGGEKKDNIIVARQLITSNLAFVVYQNEGSERVIATNALELLKWQHLAVSMDTDGHVKLYKNGATIMEGSCVIPKVVKRTSNFVGKSSFAKDDYYAGQLDDLRIYNRPLRDEEIAQLAKPQ